MQWTTCRVSGDILEFALIKWPQRETESYDELMGLLPQSRRVKREGECLECSNQPTDATWAKAVREPGLREAAAAEGSLKFCLGCGKSSDTKSDTTQQ